MAYLIFVCFCLLVALRDVFTEHLLKIWQGGLDTFFLLFVYTVITLLFASFRSHPRAVFQLNVSRKALYRELFFLVIYSNIALALYTWAIGTAIGASLNSIISFGIDPLVTALAAVWLLGEKLKPKFFATASVCLSGIALLNWNVLSTQELKGDWWWGIFLCLMSTVGYSFLIVTMKRLMNMGVTKEDIVFFRMLGLVVPLAIWLCFHSAVIQLKAVPLLVGVGFFGFCLPVYLFTWAVQRFTVVRLSILSFLAPVFTAGIAWATGMVHFGPVELLGGALILGSVALDQALNYVKDAGSPSPNPQG